MRRFSSELRAGSFWAVALAAVAGIATFQVTLNLLTGVLYPVIYSLTSLDLTDISIELSETDRFEANPFLKTARFGPSVAVMIAGFLTAIVLAQGYRWSLSASAEDTAVCPYCLSAIPVEASRCAYCGAEQPELQEGEPDEP